ncbi:hypothetical protein CEXT_267281 [Caerostris extrusa]|uniref:Uncharacterized protein n=1 Tax=Caerostris extrusa TaxID=172846 RepID=A0AAV4RRY6_CAEEX|nr:hypothetical protein CEXT_267281 [Caerostris extrusa]
MFYARDYSIPIRRSGKTFRTLDGCLRRDYKKVMSHPVLERIKRGIKLSLPLTVARGPPIISLEDYHVSELRFTLCMTMSLFIPSDLEITVQ